jgi:hypothetical protein
MANDTRDTDTQAGVRLPDNGLIEALENHARSFDVMLQAFGTKDLKGGAAASLGILLRLAANRLREVEQFFAIPDGDTGHAINFVLEHYAARSIGIVAQGDAVALSANVRSATKRFVDACKALQAEGCSFWTIEMALANTIAMGIARVGDTEEHLHLTTGAISAGVAFNRQIPEREVM